MKIINITSAILALLLCACSKDDIQKDDIGEEDARTIRPEKWFPHSDFLNLNYSHYLHSYTYDTSLSFEEINKIVQTKLGDNWVAKSDNKMYLEQTKEVLLSDGIEVLGLSVYHKKNGDYGRLSPMLTKQIGVESDTKTLILNISDPSFDPKIASKETQPIPPKQESQKK